MGLPCPKPRGTHTCAMPEDNELEEKPILPIASGKIIGGATLLTAGSAQQGLPDPNERSSEGAPGQAVSAPPILGVRYSQPGRYQKV